MTGDGGRGEGEREGGIEGRGGNEERMEEKRRIKNGKIGRGRRRGDSEMEG